MIDSLLLLHQCIHGYQDGHRMLKSSVKLEADEEFLLDQLSELSGHLPLDFDLPPYETGYRCGRFFAFGRTWYDESVKRRGAVLTHTLLIPRRLLAELDSPFVLENGFEKPTDKSDLERYSVQRSIPLPVSDPPAMTAVEAATLLMLAFSDRELPLLLEQSEAGEISNIRDIIGTLWAASDVDLREQWSFCTLALKPIHARAKPIAIQWAPWEARTAFTQLARHPLRWPLRTPILRTEQWMNFSEVSTHGLRSCYQEALRDSLEVDGRSGYKMAWFFKCLVEQSKDSVMAARAVLDLLEKIGQKASLECWKGALETYMEHVIQQPVLYPLPHLLDLCSRSRVRDLGIQSAAFSTFVIRELRRIFNYGIPKDPEMLESLNRYLSGSSIEGIWLEELWSALELHGIRAIFGLPRGIQSSLIAADQTRMVDLLGRLSPAQRHSEAQSLLDECPEPTRVLLRRAVRGAAYSWQDPELLQLVMHNEGLDNDQFLDQALGIADRSIDPPFEPFDVLRILDPNAILKWVQNRDILPVNENLIAARIAEISLGPEQGQKLIDSLNPQHSIAPRAICYYVHRNPSWDWPKYVARTQLPSSILAFAALNANATGLKVTLKRLLPELTINIFYARPAHEWLGLSKRGGWDQELLRRFVPELLRNALCGKLSDVDQTWLCSSESQQWIKNASRWDLFGNKDISALEGISPKHALAFLFGPCGRALVERHRDAQELVEMFLNQVRDDDIEVIAEHGAIILWKNLAQQSSQEGLIAQAFNYAERFPKVELSEFVAAAFLPLHQGLSMPENHSLIRRMIRYFDIFGFLGDGDWDKAGKLRKKFTKLWIDRHWPLDTFLRAFRHDKQAFEWLVDELSKRQRDKYDRFLDDLLMCASQHPDEFSVELRVLKSHVD